MNANFDKSAVDYDSVFTNTKIGKYQRDNVWSYLDRVLSGSALKVLELNCGTGEDAVFLSKKCAQILATDNSRHMIEVAKLKAKKLNSNVSFGILDLERPVLNEGNFDFVFSNFGGLNCISNDGLKEIDKFIVSHTNKNAECIFVIMPRDTILEAIYRRIKGQLDVFRNRSSQQPISVNVQGESVNTYFHNVEDITAAFKNFSVVTHHPVGFIPSYFNNSRWLPFWSLLERLFEALRLNSNKSDHYLIHLKKHS